VGKAWWDARAVYRWQMSSFRRWRLSWALMTRSAGIQDRTVRSNRSAATDVEFVACCDAATQRGGELLEMKTRTCVCVCVLARGHERFKTNRGARGGKLEGLYESSGLLLSPSNESNRPEALSNIEETRGPTSPRPAQRFLATARPAAVDRGWVDRPRLRTAQHLGRR
jgi:hypothetical protein